MFSQEQIDNLVEKAIVGGFIKFREGKLFEAEMVVKQVLKVSPEDSRALQLMGLIKHALQNYKEALAFFEKAVALDPSSENYNNMGLCYSNSGEFDKAIECLLRAEELSPHSAFIQSNLGLQYRQKGDAVKAAERLKKSLEIKEDANAWGMLGGCYGEMKKLDLAEECFRKAMEIDPHLPNVHVDLACLHHLRGEWEKGWEEYEWRYELYDQVKYWHKIYDPSLKWDGRDCKKLLVYAEQGSGDAIHFFRYIKPLRERGIYVIFHISETMKSLFEPHVDEIYTTDPGIIPTHDKRHSTYEMPAFDFHCSLMSLPYLLKIPIPACPYLFTDKKINMADYSTFFKIGVVWAGNPQHPNDINRSCHLALFRPIHDLPGVKLFSLVKDSRPRAYRFRPEPVDLSAGTEEMRVVDMAPFMNNFEDTAAIIQQLDLLITVDTATVHLAGALGCPAWCLIPYSPDWRWTLEGENTVWYPSVKLYRQEKCGEWESVFTKILEDLKTIRLK